MSEEIVEIVRRAFAALGDAQPEDLTDRALSDSRIVRIETFTSPEGALEAAGTRA